MEGIHATWGNILFLRVYLWRSLFTSYSFARLVESQQAIRVFVVVSLVCRTLLFPFVECTSGLGKGQGDRPLNLSTLGSIKPWIYRPQDPSYLGSIDPRIHQTLDLSTLGTIKPWIYPPSDLSNLGSIDPRIHQTLDLSTWTSLKYRLHPSRATATHG